MHSVGLIQKKLALENIWLRGGISSGDAYFDSGNNQVIGPAYIDAYLLEENYAIFPRVILDNKLINELDYNSSKLFIEAMNEFSSGGIKASNWGKAVLFNWQYPDNSNVFEITQDVPLFIDYLSPIVEKNIEGNNGELLKLIKNIESSIYTRGNIYSKFRWVTDYLKSIKKREEKNDNTINRLCETKLEYI